MTSRMNGDGSLSWAKRLRKGRNGFRTGGEVFARISSVRMAMHSQPIDQTNLASEAQSRRWEVAVKNEEGAGGGKRRQERKEHQKRNLTQEPQPTCPYSPAHPSRQTLPTPRCPPSPSLQSGLSLQTRPSDTKPSAPRPSHTTPGSRPVR